MSTELEINSEEIRKLKISISIQELDIQNKQLSVDSDKRKLDSDKRFLVALLEKNIKLLLEIVED